MSRLDNIIARNRQPFRLQGSRAMLLRGLFLVLILALFLFTSWATPPEDHRPGIHVVPGSAAPDRAVRGVKLYQAPKPGSAQRP